MKRIQVKQNVDFPKLAGQELDAIMWLVRIKDEIDKAGGYVTLERLQEMPLIELARMCGCNDIKPIHERGCYHRERLV